MAYSITRLMVISQRSLGNIIIKKDHQDLTYFEEKTRPLGCERVYLSLHSYRYTLSYQKGRFMETYIILGLITIIVLYFFQQESASCPPCNAY